MMNGELANETTQLLLGPRQCSVAPRNSTAIHPLHPELTSISVYIASHKYMPTQVITAFIDCTYNRFT